MGKITDEELKQIGELKQQTTQIVYNLGELQYQRFSIEAAEDELRGVLKETKLKEANILKALKDKYGNVSINIETGEF
jgi:hypothetical protein